MMYVHKIAFVTLSLLLVCYVLTNILHAQLPGNYSSYNLANGLPDNMIKAIAQDKYGYIWLGTENGLVRFDGKYFTPFSSSKTLSALPSPNIYNIVNVDRNLLAIVTKSGLNIIDVSNMVSTNLMIPKGPIKYAENANNLRDVLFDTEGNLFVISRSGLYHFNRSRQLVFRHDDYTTEQSANGMSFGAYCGWANDETLIVAGEKGNYAYHTHSKKLTKIAAGDTAFLVFSVLASLGKSQNYHLLQPSKGKFIVLNYSSDSLIYINEAQHIITYSASGFAKGTTPFTWRSNLFVVNDSLLLLSGKFKGLFDVKLNTKTGQLQVDTNAHFPDKTCCSFFMDNNRKYWLGFADGLKHEKSSAISLQLHATAGLNEPLANRNPLLQVAVTASHVYGAASVSGGLHQFAKSSLDFEKTIPFHFPPFGNQSLYAVEKWHQDTILCGTDVGLFLYDEKRNTSRYVSLPGWDPAHNWIADFFWDRSGNMWITTNRAGGCYVWKPNEKVPSWLAIDSAVQKKIKIIYHVAEDNEGNIWLAGKGIARYNSTTKNIDRYVHRFSETASQPVSVDAMVVDANGALWLTNGADGMAVYDPESKKATLLSTKDGLPDEKVTGLEYYQNHVWVTSKNGIVKVNCQSKKITSVCNLKDLYYQNFYSSRMVFDSTTGSFFTGSGASVMWFNPKEKQTNTSSPKLLIVYAKTGDDSVTWFPPATITLPWEHRNLTLFYNAINFEDADFQRYAFRFVDGNKTSGWFTQEDQRRLILTDLEPGVTVIEIKVFSPQNAWPETTIRYTITVIAPFWKTAWFWLLCTAVFFFVCYRIYRYRHQKSQHILKIRDDISKDLHDEIGATLSGIAMYSHLVKSNLASNELEVARQSVDIIQHSATDMVTKLNDIIWLIHQKKEALADMIVKLEEYAQHMCIAKNIKADVVVLGPASSYKPPIDTRKNLYLFCKEAINNAVKYSKSSQLLVKFLLEDHWLTICIQDTGTGFDAAGVKKGNGLDNMQKRAADLNAEYTLQSQPGEGCTIMLRLKITL